MPLLANQWSHAFAARDPGLDVEALEWGEEDRSPEMIRWVRQALLCERLGAAAVRRYADNAPDPEVAKCIAAHATEEEGHVRLLQHLLGGEVEHQLGFAARMAVRYLGRLSPLEEHCLTCLVVEGAAVAFYGIAVESLGPGRAREVIRRILDEERLHIEFTRDLLAALIRELPPRAVRRLRRRRNVLVAVVMLAQALDHRRIFQPAFRVPVGTASRRIVAEIEAALCGIPHLTVPQPDHRPA